MKREHIRKYENLWSLFPLLFWYECCGCDREFRREHGWRAITGPYGGGGGRVRYLCSECAPTREAADDFFLNSRFVGERPASPSAPPQKVYPQKTPSRMNSKERLMSKRMARRIMKELYHCVEILGGDIDLLGAVGSYGDTLPDSEVLALLQDWRKKNGKKKTDKEI